MYLDPMYRNIVGGRPKKRYTCSVRSQKKVHALKATKKHTPRAALPGNALQKILEAVRRRSAKWHTVRPKGWGGSRLSCTAVPSLQYVQRHLVNKLVQHLLVEFYLARPLRLNPNPSPLRGSRSGGAHMWPPRVALLFLQKKNFGRKASLD